MTRSGNTSPSGPPALVALPARAGGQAVLRLVGDIDVTTVRTLRAAVRRCLREYPGVLSLDLCSVNFCDAAGANALRHARREAADVNAEFRIIAPGPLVRHVFTLLDAGDLLSAAQDQP
jgi:anti-anti-sigma factor